MTSCFHIRYTEAAFGRVKVDLGMHQGSPFTPKADGGHDIFQYFRTKLLKLVIGTEPDAEYIIRTFYPTSRNLTANPPTFLD